MSDPSMLSAAQRDARARRDAGDLRTAIRLLADAIDGARPVYGEDHPQILAAAHQLAALHRAADEPTDARRVLEEALAAGQRRLGDGDPLLLAISFDLGSVAEELGNRHEARKNFGRVAAAGPAVLGPDHWAVRAARAYLGDAAAGVPPNAPDLGEPARLGARVAAAGLGTVSAAPPTPPPYAARLAPPPPPPPPVGAEHPVPLPRPTPTRRNRGAAVAAGVAAVAAVIAAVLAGLALLRDTGGTPGSSGNTGTDGGRGSAATTGTDATNPPVSIDGEPPRDVRVSRDGGAIVLTWTDPAPGRASFVITGGKEGEELRFVGQLPSGAPPRFPVHGYSPTVDYCFQVAAVYSTTELGVAQPVCTPGAKPSPAG